jgi:hypothetical protein
LSLSSIFSDYSFRVHHLVNQDKRYLLAHAMASAIKCLNSLFSAIFNYQNFSTP